MIKRFISLCLFAMIFTGLHAQFLLKAEFRPRFEYRGGYGKILSQEESGAWSISQRTRLSAYYTTGIYSFGAGIQDIMVWGDEDIYSSTGVFGNAASIDINEAWAAIKPYKNGVIKIGRQYWIYEDERLLSGRTWNQSEIKYDGVLFQHNQEKLKIDAGFSWNNDIDKYAGNEYPSAKMKSMNFLYARKDLNDWLHATVMILATGFTKTDSTPEINWQGTYAAYLGAKKGAFNALASGFYQNGRNRKGLQTSAYMFALTADYLLKEKYSIGAGIDYLSGNDQSSSDPAYLEKAHTFDIFYGARHRYFGSLDLFNNLPKSTADGGLIDIYLKLKWIPLPSTIIGADMHFFSLQNNVSDKTTGNLSVLSKALGQEVDLNISWDISKILNIKGGYSFFLVTESMEKLQAIEPGKSKFPTWIWLMIAAKPVFFDSDRK